MDKVFLKDVLAEMRKLDERKKPIPFTITVRTYNKQNSFGGKLCTYTGSNPATSKILKRIPTTGKTKPAISNSATAP